MKLIVDPAKCTCEGSCVRACPMGAIAIIDGVAVIDPDKCDLDGICIPACPREAISFAD